MPAVIASVAWHLSLVVLGSEVSPKSARTECWRGKPDMTETASLKEETQ